MSDFETYIKGKYPRDYAALTARYPNQTMEELYPSEFAVWEHLQDHFSDIETRYIQAKKELGWFQKQIDETSQTLIDKAVRDASSDPYMYENKRAYFQGISEGLNIFRHSVGLKDDLDKEMEGKHAE